MFMPYYQNNFLNNIYWTEIINRWMTLISYTLMICKCIKMLYHCNILSWKVSPNNACFHFWTFFVIQFIYFWRYRVIIIVYFWYAFLIAYHPYPIKIHAWTFSIYEHLKKYFHWIENIVHWSHIILYPFY